MKKPIVCIIILNWNGYKDTIECIESLHRIDYPNYKIVLIDNRSTDDSVRVLSNMFPKIKLIENKKNLGFSGGVNVGIKYALKNSADYVLLLNNDTTVEKSFLSELIRVGELNNNVGILSPFIYYSDKKSVIWSSGLNLQTKSSWPFYDENKFKKDIGQFKSIRYTEFLTGCCMLIKKEVIEEIGFFSEEYFLYLEDMDFSIRCKKGGYKICSVPQSKVWHKIGQSSKKEGEIKVRYYFIRNILLFYKYNYALKSRYVFYFYFLNSNFKKVIKYTFQKRYDGIKPILFGILHGFLRRTGYAKI